MKIIRVLNTNAVVSLNQEGREIIITGAGIGFKKKKGQELDKALIDKVYYLQNAEDNSRLQQVVKEISETYLDIASKVVDSARKVGLKVHDTLYVTLTDHIILCNPCQIKRSYDKTYRIIVSILYQLLKCGGKFLLIDSSSIYIQVTEPFHR